MDVEKNKVNLNITASVGVASSNASGADSLEELLDLSDQALYLAKSAGRNCVRYVQNTDG